MRSVFFIPPLKKMSGGVANIYDVALALAEVGKGVALCYMEPGTPGLGEMAQRGLKLMEWDDCDLKAGEIWCIPEGWPNAAARGIQAGARTLVYAQNWAYLMGVLPEGVRWKDLAKNGNMEFMAVSDPVAWFMREVLELKVDKILPPVVRECFFCEPVRRAGRVRVGFMPRKNSALARQIQELSLEILRKSGEPDYLDWVELQNLPQDELAQQLARCDIFMMSSMAEGFGLPPIEAMASGCVPVGFAGLGGWGYMRSSPLSPCHQQVVSSLPPGLALPEKAWGPNGFYAPDGDVISAAFALSSAIQLALEGSPDWTLLQAECRKTALAHNRKAMSERLLSIWN